MIPRVGERIAIYWEGDLVYYTCRVLAHVTQNGETKTKVSYDFDGEQETIDLKRHKWRRALEEEPAKINHCHDYRLCGYRLNAFDEREQWMYLVGNEMHKMFVICSDFNRADKKEECLNLVGPITMQSTQLIGAVAHYFGQKHYMDEDCMVGILESCFKSVVKQLNSLLSKIRESGSNSESGPEAMRLVMKDCRIIATDLSTKIPNEETTASSRNVVPTEHHSEIEDGEDRGDVCDNSIDINRDGDSSLWNLKFGALNLAKVVRSNGTTNTCKVIEKEAASGESVKIGAGTIAITSPHIQVAAYTKSIPTSSGVAENCDVEDSTRQIENTAKAIQRATSLQLLHSTEIHLHSKVGKNVNSVGHVCREESPTKNSSSSEDDSDVSDREESNELEDKLNRSTTKDNAAEKLLAKSRGEANNIATGTQKWHARN